MNSHFVSDEDFESIVKVYSGEQLPDGNQIGLELMGNTNTATPLDKSLNTGLHPALYVFISFLAVSILLSIIKVIYDRVTGRGDRIRAIENSSLQSVTTGNNEHEGTSVRVSDSNYGEPSDTRVNIAQPSYCDFNNPGPLLSNTDIKHLKPANVNIPLPRSCSADTWWSSNSDLENTVSTSSVGTSMLSSSTRYKSQTLNMDSSILSKSTVGSSMLSISIEDKSVSQRLKPYTPNLDILERNLNFKHSEDENTDILLNISEITPKITNKTKVADNLPDSFSNENTLMPSPNTSASLELLNIEDFISPENGKSSVKCSDIDKPNVTGNLTDSFSNENTLMPSPNTSIFLEMLNFEDLISPENGNSSVKSSDIDRPNVTGNSTDSFSNENTLMPSPNTSASVELLKIEDLMSPENSKSSISIHFTGKSENVGSNNSLKTTDNFERLKTPFSEVDPLHCNTAQKTKFSFIEANWKSPFVCDPTAWKSPLSISQNNVTWLTPPSSEVFNISSPSEADTIIQKNGKQ